MHCTCPCLSYDPISNKQNIPILMSHESSVCYKPVLNMRLVKGLNLVLGVVFLAFPKWLTPWDFHTQLSNKSRPVRRAKLPGMTIHQMKNHCICLCVRAHTEHNQANWPPALRSTEKAQLKDFVLTSSNCQMVKMIIFWHILNLSTQSKTPKILNIYSFEVRDYNDPILTISTPSSLKPSFKIFSLATIRTNTPC